MMILPLVVDTMMHMHYVQIGNGIAKLNKQKKLPLYGSSFLKRISVKIYLEINPAKNLTVRTSWLT